MNPVLSGELSGTELWRRQCARNLMDCYALGMEGLMENPGEQDLEALTRLMVDGMTSVRGEEDEKAFYRTAASLCRSCARQGRDKKGLFRIYSAIFEEMAGKEAEHE